MTKQKQKFCSLFDEGECKTSAKPNDRPQVRQ